MVAGPMPNDKKLLDMRDHGRELAAIAEAHPGWDIISTWDGWMAVPKGTPFLKAGNLDRLVDKIRAQEDQEP